MTATNLADWIEQARQGHPGAITHLLNSALVSKGIKAKVNRQDGQLIIFLEGKEIPEPSSLRGVIQRGIKDLSLETIDSVKIYGRKIGESSTSWQEEIVLRRFPGMNLPTSGANEDIPFR